jgi:hypothetical protein
MDQMVGRSESKNGSMAEVRACHELFIESHGVKMRFASNDPEALCELEALLPDVLAGQYEIKPTTDAEHEFRYTSHRSGSGSLEKNGEVLAQGAPRASLMDQLCSKIRQTVAEYAVGKVFVHAGVVAWKDRAIVLPARSFGGKSTLVAELVRRGAVYYSDEYAILDEHGLVSPFPKPLSIRGVIDEYQQVHYPVESFGGTAGTKAIPVCLVLLTKYDREGVWQPKFLSQADGTIEIIQNTVPIRRDPKFVLSVLDKVVRNAVIVSSPRGEASETSNCVIDLFEEVSS